jgi:hypothetical protein
MSDPAPETPEELGPTIDEALQRLEKERAWRRISYYRHRDRILAERKKKYWSTRDPSKRLASPKRVLSLEDQRAEKREKYRIWREANKERLKEKERLRYAKDKEANKAKSRAWYAANKERARASCRAWREANRDKHSQANRVWKANNKARLREYRRRPSNLVAENLRLRIRLSIQAQGAGKTVISSAITGCSWEYLRGHLEKQFTGAMTWENHGRVWHIDHIIPCAKFDLTKPEEQRMCFHYSNLRPLCAFKNISDSARKGEPQQATMFHLLDNPNDL